MSDNIPVISKKEITYGERLGQGGFGTVYKGLWGQSQIAIKTLRIQELEEDIKDEFLREAKTMWKLSNPAVIRLYGICREPGSYALLMELMIKGDLYHFLASKEKFEWPQRWQMAIEIGSGLSYLHSQSIFHRDLKSQNILLDANRKPKLTDFGLSKLKQKSQTTVTYSGGGTPAWMAPEMFDKKTRKTLKADIYSYAMVLWEIATRKEPFKDEGLGSILGTIFRGEREEIPNDTPAAYSDVVKKCWVQKPEDRPSAEAAVKLLQEARPQKVSEPKQQETVKVQPTTSDIPGPKPSTQVEKVSLSTLKNTDKTIPTGSSWTHVRTLVPPKGSKFQDCVHLGSDDLAVHYSRNGYSIVRIWDIERGKELKILYGFRSMLIDHFLSMGRNILAGSDVDRIMILDIARDKCIKKLKGHKSVIRSLTALNDRQLVSGGSNDRMIKVWDVKKGKCIRTLQEHTGQITDLLHLAGPLFASASEDKTVKIWNSYERKCCRTYTGHASPVAQLVDLKDGTIASADTDNTVKIWKPGTDQCLKTLKGVRGRLVVPAKGLLAAVFKDVIELWSTTGQRLETQSFKRSTKWPHLLPVGRFLSPRFARPADIGNIDILCFYKPWFIR